MDSIPFEKVSIAQAKVVLDQDTAPAQPTRNWISLRELRGANNMDLTDQAWQWLDHLPVELQPGGLVQRFPRIANKLAELWTRPLQCGKYLEALMFDHRGSRKGFPPDVAQEIALLNLHVHPSVMEQRSGVWDEVVR